LVRGRLPFFSYAPPPACLGRGFSAEVFHFGFFFLDFFFGRQFPRLSPLPCFPPLDMKSFVLVPNRLPISFWNLPFPPTLRLPERRDGLVAEAGFLAIGLRTQASPTFFFCFLRQRGVVIQPPDLPPPPAFFSLSGYGAGFFPRVSFLPPPGWASVPHIPPPQAVKYRRRSRRRVVTGSCRTPRLLGRSKPRWDAVSAKGD